MSLFFNILAASVSNIRVGGSNPSAPVESEDLFDVSLKLQANTSAIPVKSFYFFYPYKTTDFSKVVCDKEYFFLFSTDHDSNLGGLFIGKGNNLDLSDFQYVGQIQIFGSQIETPRLVERNGVLFMYSHTDSNESGNNNMQQTRVHTYSGLAAELQTITTWVDGGRPLGIVGDDNHTGYFNTYPNSSVGDIGIHITRGGLPQPCASSISSDGGYTYTRLEEDIDSITGVETNYFAQLQDGRYFTYKGQQFWIGHLHPQSNIVTTGIWKVEKKIIIAKTTNAYFSSITQKRQIYPDLMLRSSPYIVGDIAYVYFTKLKTDLYVGKYDLRNLDQWLT